MKVCNICGISKSRDDFYKRSDGRGDLRSDCKKCHSDRAKRKNATPESIEKRKKSWRKYQRFKLYGITEDDYNKMNDEQSSRCLICGVLDDNLSIDHCHRTGRVRGLLCHTCNTGLGMFKDNEDILEKAIEYLRL